MNKIFLTTFVFASSFFVPLVRGQETNQVASSEWTKKDQKLFEYLENNRSASDALVQLLQKGADPKVTVPRTQFQEGIEMGGDTLLTKAVVKLGTPLPTLGVDWVKMLLANGVDPN